VGSTGKQGAVRSSAWICDFSSTHKTRAFSGGARYNPTTSRTLSMNWGSVDSFHVCTMWGLRPNARQIRETADWDMPADLAIDRVDQWVSPPGGACSSVAVITFSTCSSVTVRGRPGRGSSLSPSRRAARNRDRHLPAVVLDTPSSAATALTAAPSAQARMIRDRSASACAVFRRRAHPSRTRRSSSDSASGSSFGLATRQAY
jgi:hypothetical protein